MFQHLKENIYLFIHIQLMLKIYLVQTMCFKSLNLLSKKVHLEVLVAFGAFMYLLWIDSLD
jgi:hypothetical protein